MIGYSLITCLLFLASEASVIYDRHDNIDSDIMIEDYSDTIQPFLPDPTCDLIIWKGGYVVDDVATGFGGDRIFIKCDARCKGRGATPALEWIKNPRQTPIASTRCRISSYSRSSSRIQMLLITSFQQRDVGSYTCRGWLGPILGWVNKTISLQMGCSHPSISCDVSRCLPAKYRCDGVKQCEDGFDEYGCGANVCQDSEFYCDNSCRSITVRCNGIYDCYDGKDELDCKPDTTTESTLITIPTTTATNTSTNTSDCEGDLFLCSDGRCIPSSRLCDGMVDCPFEEDESDCWMTSAEPTTQSTTMGPTSTTTITTTAESTDTVTTETSDCTENGTFLCSNGRCIPSTWICDSIIDCPGGEDEIECWSTENTTSTLESTTKVTTKAKVTTTTIMSSERPTSTVSESTEPSTPTSTKPETSTVSESTEPLTTTVVTTETKTTAEYGDSTTTVKAPVCDGQFDCGGGVCIALAKRCDSFPDCDDHRDEEHCSTLICSESLRACADSSKCVDPSQLCNGQIDCPDGSDEQNCD